jgi:DNA modification methylase
METSLPLLVDFRDPAVLLANPSNAKIHTQKQITQICTSIITFSFVNPVLIDEHRVIIAGHGRVLAALKLGLKQIPVIELRHLTETQKRALMLADNKIAENSGWDTEKLRQELIVLSSPDIELSEIAGFETAEVDMIVDGPSGKPKRDPLDLIEEPNRSEPAVTQPGDLVALGPHRILCGDALLSETYDRLLGDEQADQVLVDPPYNLKVKDIGGLGRVQHPEFAVASGEMTRAQFQRFLDTVFRNMADRCVDGAILMSFMDWRHIDQLLQAGQTLKFGLKNICVWNKLNGGMGSLYRSQHELVAVFKVGRAPHINNIELGQHGRYRTNVWNYAGASMFRKGRQEDLATHPTVKPIALVVDAIKDCSNRNGIILDAFGGSGTTLLAAERTGRRARLIEIDPYYVDATIERWRKMTGGEPKLIGQALPEEAA